MRDRNEREVLLRLLSSVRRRLFLISSAGWLARAALPVLLLTASAVAADQRWNQGQFSSRIVLAALAAAVLFSLLLAWRGLGQRIGAALTLDNHARLQDRVSSAWEFLAQPTLNEAQQVQIRDAIQRAESLDFKQVLRFRWPRFVMGLPVVLLLW